MPMLTRIAVLCLAFGVAGGSAIAQAPPPPVTTSPGPPPVIDPAKELQGRALVDALRKGGLVLYVRHARGEAGMQPCTGIAITAEGREQARKLGSALRELRIPVGAVLASQTCRAQDTASMIGVGETESTEDLNPADLPSGYDVSPARNKRLAEMPRAGSNTLLVSHVHAGRRMENWINLGLCEVIAYRPDGNGGADAVARIPLAAWQGLIRNATVD